MQLNLQMGQKQTLVVLLGLALLILALYANSLGNDFVLDDTSYVRDNYLLRDLSNLPKFFAVPPDGVVEDLSPGFLRGRNLRWVTYAIDFALGGGSPWIFHLSNVLWHFLAGGALFLLLRKWLAPFAAGAAAAVFIAHPIQTAAVSYISGRKDILAAFFLLATLLAIGRWRETKRKWWFLAASLLFVLAFSGKEVAVVLPLLLCWGDLCRGDQSFGEAVQTRLRRHWPEYLLLFALAGILAWHQAGGRLLSAFIPDGTGEVVVREPASVSLEGNLSYANLMFFYLGKLLLPVKLLADYRGAFDFSLYPPAHGWFWTLLFLLCLVPLLLFLRRRWPAGALGLGWIIISLLPVSHIVAFHYPVAEHYLYLPCAGFALSIGGGFAALKEKFGSRPALAGLLLLLVFYGGGTIARNRDWQNMETVTLDILQKAPKHLAARSTLTHLYSVQGRTAEAIAQAREILRQHPGSAINHYNLGVLYEKVGEVDAAIHHYSQAIDLQRTLWDAYLNLGNLQLLHGRTEEGLQTLSFLISRYGYHPLAYFVLGNHSARQGDWSAALGYYQQTLQLDPHEPAGYLGVAGAFWRLDRVGEAKVQLRLALDQGLDLEWAAGDEPWATFLAKSEVQQFVNSQKKENGHE